MENFQNMIRGWYTKSVNALRNLTGRKDESGPKE